MDLSSIDISDGPEDFPGRVSSLLKGIAYSPLQWPYLLSVCICLLLGGLYLRKETSLPLPPGPYPLPIIGNIHQLLSKPLPETLLEWHQKYGPIVSFQSGSRLMVSVASHDICQDLMMRKGTLYNSRPDIVVAGRYATKGLHIALMPFGKQWQAHRRILASVTTENASRKYRLLEEVESLQVMVDFLSSDDFSAIFRRYGASLTNALGYGRRLTHDDEAEFRESEQLARRLVDVMMADFHFALVEIFPVLDYLPDFLAPWKAFGRKYYSEATSFYSKNFLKAQSTSSWNWVKHSLTRPEAKDMQIDEISMLFGTALQAAVETIPSVLRVFVKAMLLRPECLTKAQAELDQIVGPGRVPSFSDMPSLPYTNAIVNECCRWQAVIALGLPHCNMHDDEYGGYRFPKGTLVFANAWAIGFDETLYNHARDFLPERWVESPELPNGAAFGYGRRVCPGKFIGIDSLFINIARLLWGYEFARGEREVKLWDIDHAFTSSPRDFDAKFSIRSVKHRETLEKAWTVADTDADAILGKIEADHQT
ncbi:cytochrome P450 [Penicillium hispanicum]|uniref:cytochrome P450 n=1 Tax=Penicillium hispanicum TaxID=1080232 RepID=UPI00254196AC|nr:cytochrome P450 [Penicillium hispanicum]KAJ5570436.1 cytochrome P450 [Penicillium hispanicum]